MFQLVATRPFPLRLWEGATFGLFKPGAPELSKKLEPDPKVPDEVQDSPVPSQGDSGSNSAEGESS